MEYGLLRGLEKGVYIAVVLLLEGTVSYQSLLLLGM